MSTTVSEILSGVYEKLRNPKTTDLSMGLALTMFNESLEYYLNMLNMSDSNWVLGSKTIVVAPGIDTYVIEDEDFGRGVMVETSNAETNELYLRRQLDLVDKQNINPMRIEPVLATAVTTPYYKHNSYRVAFYTDKNDGLQRIQFDPTPLASATYKIFYEPVGLNKPDIASNVFFLRNFTALLKTATALKCLFTLVETMSVPLYSSLKEGLVMELGRLETQFATYIMNSQQETAGPIKPYNNSLWF